MIGIMQPAIRKVLVSAGILLALQAPATAGWKRANLGRAGDYCSISLDTDGRPHISYLDPTKPTDYVLRHAFFDGRKWHKEIVDSGDVGWWNSIALDSQNRIHIAYQDAGPPWQLRYALFDGTSWTTATLDEGGFSTDIAIDPNGHPHISYAGNALGTDVSYAHFDGSNWIIEDIAANALYFGGTSIELDSSGHAHISYSDLSAPRRLYWATNSSGSWVSSYVADGRQGSLALDDAGLPRLLYVDETSGTLTYAAWNGLTWTSTGLPAGDAPSLAIDDYNRPHISFGYFFLVLGANVLAVGLDDGAGFMGDLIIGPNITTTSLALDAFGLPHVAARRATPNGKGNLVYAQLTLPDLTAALQNISRTSGVSSDEVTATLVVANEGNSGSKAVPVQYYLSDDAFLDGADAAVGQRRSVGAVGAGRTRSAAFRATFPFPVSGKYLIAVLDGNGKNREILESNNTTAALIP